MSDDVAVGRAVQSVRLSRNLRQSDVAARAGIGRPTISRLERGLVEGLSVGTLRAVSRALGMPSLVSLGWRGPEARRLRDATHAAMIERLVAMLQGLGWEATPEHSFSHYGERGSVDVLGWHEARRALLVTETKSRLWDLQETLMTLDRKRRLMPELARRHLGRDARSVGVLLVMPDTRSHRRVVARHAATFRAAFPGGSRATAWLEAPVGDFRGLMYLTIDRQVVTRQRARRRRARPNGPTARSRPEQASGTPATGQNAPDSARRHTTEPPSGCGGPGRPGRQP